jgi:hypothetical protein
LFEECCDESECCDEGSCWDFFWFTKKRDFARNKKCENVAEEGCGAPLPPACKPTGGDAAAYKNWLHKATKASAVNVKPSACPCACDKCTCDKRPLAVPCHPGKCVCFPAQPPTCCPMGKFAYAPPYGPAEQMIGCPVPPPAPHARVMVWASPAPPCTAPVPPTADRYEAPWTWEKMAALMAENAALKARHEVEKQYTQRVKELEQQLSEAKYEIARLKNEHATGHGAGQVMSELVKAQAESAAQKDEMFVELLGGLLELQLELPEAQAEPRLEKLEQVVKQVREENEKLRVQLTKLKEETKRVIRAQQAAEQEDRQYRATRRDCEDDPR